MLSTTTARALFGGALFAAGLTANAEAQVTFNQRAFAAFGTTNITPGAFKIVDLDGDGDRDILYGAYGGGLSVVRGLRWFQSDGQPVPSFTNYEIFGNIPVTALDAADLNADNDIDILLGFGSYRSGSIFRTH